VGLSVKKFDLHLEFGDFSSEKMELLQYFKPIYI